MGVRVTWSCVVVLAALALHPTWLSAGQQRAGFLIVVAVAGLVVVPMTPARWRRRLVARSGRRLLVVWSAVDVLVIAAGIAVTGDPTLAYVFVLPVVFFSSMLPLRIQLALLGLIGVSYATTIRFGWVRPSLPELVIWAMTVGAAAWLVAFVSGELRRRAEGELVAQRVAQRRSQLVSTVAEAARDVFCLNPDEVLDRVVQAASDLGFDITAIVERDAAADGYRATHHVGMPDWYIDAPHPMNVGIVGDVFARPRTVVTDRYDRDPRRIHRFVEDGYHIVVATPVRLPDEVPAVLVASRRSGTICAEEVEALELLAVHAGAALSNARRFSRQQQLTDRLAEVDRLKNRMIETVSHELRTPVTVVKAALELLERHADAFDSDRRADLVARAAAHAEDLVVMIERLTSFRELDRDAHDPDIVPTPVRPVIVSAVDRAAARCHTHLLTWGVDRQAVVDADPNLLRLVLDQLIDNACTHTPVGTHVQVTCHCEDDHAVVAVTDDGGGLPDAVAASVGDAFARGADTLTRRGLGLGLAAVVRALQAHDTTLQIVDGHDRGTRLSFRLPLTTDASERRDVQVVELDDLVGRVSKSG